MSGGSFFVTGHFHLEKFYAFFKSIYPIHQQNKKIVFAHYEFVPNSTKKVMFQDNRSSTSSTYVKMIPNNFSFALTFFQCTDKYRKLMIYLIRDKTCHLLAEK